MDKLWIQFMGIDPINVHERHKKRLDADIKTILDGYFYGSCPLHDHNVSSIINTYIPNMDLIGEFYKPVFLDTLGTAHCYDIIIGYVILSYIADEL